MTILLAKMSLKKTHSRLLASKRFLKITILVLFSLNLKKMNLVIAALLKSQSFYSNFLFTAFRLHILTVHKNFQTKVLKVVYILLKRVLHQTFRVVG